MEIWGVPIDVVVAIVAPLAIEAAKRPKLLIEWAPDANNPKMYGGPTRITPCQGDQPPDREPFARFLPRDTATNCRVRRTFTSRSNGRAAWSGPAKWDAQPEPIQWLPSEGGIHEFIDQRPATASEVYGSATPPGQGAAPRALSAAAFDRRRPVGNPGSGHSSPYPRHPPPAPYVGHPGRAHLPADRRAGLHGPCADHRDDDLHPFGTAKGCARRFTEAVEAAYPAAA